MSKNSRDGSTSEGRSTNNAGDEQVARAWRVVRKFEKLTRDAREFAEWVQRREEFGQ